MFSLDRVNLRHVKFNIIHRLIRTNSTPPFNMAFEGGEAEKRISFYSIGIRVQFFPDRWRRGRKHRANNSEDILPDENDVKRVVQHKVRRETASRPATAAAVCMASRPAEHERTHPPEKLVFASC